jgi:small subunit ribosomal protein S6
LDGDDLTALIETVKELVTRSGGQVIQVKPWGVRRLAYPIAGHWEGQYVLMHLDLVPQSVAELERSLKLSENILRHLITLVGEEATGAESAEPDAA